VLILVVVSLPLTSGIGLLLDGVWLAVSTLMVASEVVRLTRRRCLCEASLATYSRQKKEGRMFKCRRLNSTVKKDRLLAQVTFGISSSR
jgi:hypothetical protein